VELKNDVTMSGVLQSVDQYLNIRINDVVITQSEMHPQLVSYTQILFM